jgi:hypothetical protein
MLLPTHRRSRPPAYRTPGPGIKSLTWRPLPAVGLLACHSESKSYLNRQDSENILLDLSTCALPICQPDERGRSS